MAGNYYGTASGNTADHKISERFLIVLPKLVNIFNMLDSTASLIIIINCLELKHSSSHFHLSILNTIKQKSPTQKLLVLYSMPRPPLPYIRLSFSDIRTIRLNLEFEHCKSMMRHAMTSERSFANIWVPELLDFNRCSLSRLGTTKKMVKPFSLN